MIDIPIGKALVVVEALQIINKPSQKFVGDPGHKSVCDSCFFDFYWNINDGGLCKKFACGARKRKDGKNVIFKLVDWPGVGGYYNGQT